MKRVLILRSNPVNPDSRVEKEAWSLTKAGYDVTILAWDRSLNHKENKDKIIVSNVSIPIIRLGFKAEFGAGMKSIVPYLKFQFRMRKWIRNHRNEIDIVHACDFDTAFFSYKLCKRFKKKYIFDIFDMLATIPKNFLQRRVLNAEKRIINNADATIICSEERKSQIEGTKPNRLCVVHNSPSESLIGGSTRFDLDNNKIKVVYVGILQEDRMLLELLDYFSKHHEYEFHSAGFGRLEKRFLEAADANDNIFFYGKINYAEALELESKCDIMLAIYDPKYENNRNAAPNKFYESLMLGKPVIMVKETQISHVIEENKIGILIDYNKESFSNAIDYLDSIKNKWKSISARAKRLYYEKYNWELMEKRLIALYEEL